MTRRAWLMIPAAFLSCGPAFASFHLMQVVEVFPGTEASPSAQYIVLQMYAAGQQFISGHPVRVYGPTGSVVGTFTFVANVPNGANQTKILISTPQASAFFGLSADLAMTAVLPPAGGAVCFDTIDCVSWGNFSGALPSSAGTPARLCATTGLDLGSALIRRLNIAGNPTMLENGDDTNNSANDFVFGLPAPRNNAGQTGTIPSAVCGNGALEGLEACDDSDTDPGDGCNSVCQMEACGNCTVDSGETCDPPGVGTCGGSCQIAPPGEVSSSASAQPLRFTSHDTLVWQDGSSLGATAFNVYRGTVTDLPFGDYGSCFASPVTTNTTVDATNPDPGVALTYLVTATNAGGEGPAGNDSQGTPRTFGSPCP